MAHEPRMETVQCTDGLDRPTRAVVELDKSGTKVVITLPPNGSKFDWRQLDELIGVCVQLRQQLSGHRP